jgi:hypothetical protein
MKVATAIPERKINIPTAIARIESNAFANLSMKRKF